MKLGKSKGKSKDAIWVKKKKKKKYPFDLFFLYFSFFLQYCFFFNIFNSCVKFGTASSFFLIFLNKANWFLIFFFFFAYIYFYSFFIVQFSPLSSSCSSVFFCNWEAFLKPNHQWYIQSSLMTHPPHVTQTVALHKHAY